MAPAASRPDANDLPLAHPWRALALYLIASGLFYGFVTHWPLGPIATIAPGPLERLVPRWPLSVPAYLSYLLVMPVLVSAGHARRWLLPAFFAGVLAAFACLFCHLFHPTAVLRPATPDAWLAWLYRIDSPLAASPSGHLALPVAIAVVLAGLRERIGAVFFAWSALLAVTVLTTGQHTLADLAGGVAVGLAAAAATLALRRLNVDLRTMGALLAEWGCLVVTLRLAVALGSGWGYALAALVIATRQHALFILYHDATHYHLSRRRAVNDVLIDMAIGVPGLVPVAFYRPLHLAHHRDVGTERDPERQFLYHGQPWRFRPLGARLLARQVLGDLLLLNMLRNMAAYRRTRPPPIRSGPAFVVAAASWLAIVAVLMASASAHTLATLALLWFGPLLTLSVAIQKIRSMAEHSGGPHVTPGWAEWTYSWHVGWLGRAVLWPYHINLHLQHHRRPAVPWHALPGELDAHEAQLAGAELRDLLLSPSRSG